jgi:peptide/nickel transport system substrate-binding protein
VTNRSVGILLATMAVASALTSCIPIASDVSIGIESPPRQGTSLGGVTAARADVLQLVYSDDPDTLNLITSGDTVSGRFQALVAEQLAARNLHDPDKLVAGLAESWEFDQERLEFTIHLRRGVSWHPLQLPDGSPLAETEFTARDVMFTFACILNPHVEAESLRSTFENAEAKDASQRHKISIEHVDDYTVRVRWKQPYFLAEEATLQVPIMPRHVYSVDRHGDLFSLDFSSKEFAAGFNNHWANTRMCGTGPMIFDRWDRTERVVLRRNPMYWGSPFYFSRVVFHCETNDNTATQKLLQQKFDWVEIAQTDLLLEAAVDPRVVAGKVEFKQYVYPSYRYIGYNLRRPFLDEQPVRRALSHAMPIDMMIAKVLHGLAERTTGHFQPGSPAYDTSLAPIAYDLDRARRLLDEAGWIDSNRNGIRDKQIGDRRLEARFELLLNADIRDYVTIAEIIQSNLSRIGVALKITPLAYQVLLDKQRARNFDAIMNGWSLTWRSDPFDIWDGSQADLPGSSNTVGYANPRVDRWIDELRTTFDRRRQVELYHLIQRQIYEDQPYTFLFVEKQTGGLNSRIKNVKFYKPQPCVDLREWYADGATE